MTHVSTDPVTNTPASEVEQPSPSTPPEPGEQNSAFKNQPLEKRWGKALVRTGLWFAAAFFVTQHLSGRLPAHPIVVTTNSIDTGVYWLDLKRRALNHEDIIAFNFVPATEQLKSRMPPSRHVKMLWGMPGDTVTVGEEGGIQVCTSITGANQCRPAGVAQPFDSQGRPLTPWLSEGKSYVLKDGEYWVYAPNPKSLDSRYNGPIRRDQIRGIAKPLWVWKKHDE